MGRFLKGLAALALTLALLPGVGAAQMLTLGTGPARAAAGGGSGLLTSWDGTLKPTNIDRSTVSVANDKATENSGSNYGTIETSTSFSGGVGNHYFTVTVDAVGTAVVVGFATSGQFLGPNGNGYLGSGNGSGAPGFGFNSSGHYLENNVDAGAVADPYTTGDSVKVRYDQPNGKAYLSVNGGAEKPVGGQTVAISFGGDIHGGVTLQNSAAVTLTASDF